MVSQDVTLMDFSNLDAIAVASLTFAVAGVVELVKRVFEADYKTAGVIAVAGLAGALLAPYAGDVTWFNGLLIGFSASGLIATVSHLK